MGANLQPTTVTRMGLYFVPPCVWLPAFSAPLAWEGHPVTKLSSLLVSAQAQLRQKWVKKGLLLAQAKENTEDTSQSAASPTGGGGGVVGGRGLLSLSGSVQLMNIQLGKRRETGVPRLTATFFEGACAV